MLAVGIQSCQRQVECEDGWNAKTGLGRQQWAAGETALGLLAEVLRSFGQGAALGETRKINYAHGLRVRKAGNLKV